MKLIAVSICVALCLGLTVGQVQLRVYRGTLVHSRILEQIEVLQDHLLGFDENNLWEVSTTAGMHSMKCFRYNALRVLSLPRSVVVLLNIAHGTSGLKYSYLHV